ncbi:LLM class flavin-dependent oxidoreductase [Flavobacterium sp.]|uniref:LLM class flavin-dependent oxidoreductase n=1 Tax=Flavobacterium sp. TaxID=239 RepID=UPI00404754DD
MKYGILDFGTIQKDSNAISTIHETIEMAQMAEELGFSRYWLSEHHEDNLAWKNPDLILPLLAGYTENIRIGSAGVLVGLHAPINTAYHYKLLANLYPSRIDLGLAKGKTEVHKSLELVDGGDWKKNMEDFFNRVKKIKSLINDEVTDIILPPKQGESPELWILGTSNSSQDFIIQEQTNFSLSLFHLINGMPSPNIIKEMKEAYFKKHQKELNVNITLSAFCSKSDKRIEEIREKTKNIMLNFSGKPEYFIPFLEQQAKLYNVDEIIILNLGETIEEKQLLMEVFKTTVSA